MESIKRYFGKKKIIAVSGLLKDKDYNLEASMLKEVADFAYTITPSSDRALSAEDYASVLRSHGIDAESCLSVKEALLLGISKAKEQNTALVALGSLYTYSEVTSALNEISSESDISK